MLSSDHAPHTEEEGRADSRDASEGVPSVETMLPLMLHAVKQNLIPLRWVIKAMSATGTAFCLDDDEDGLVDCDDPDCACCCDFTEDDNDPTPCVLELATFALIGAGLMLGVGL